MFIGRIKSDAIDINSFEEDIIENFLEDNAREKVLNIAEKLYKKENSNNIKEAYIELKNILEEFRNIILSYNKSNEKNYNEITNKIKEYQKKAPKKKAKNIFKSYFSTVFVTKGKEPKTSPTKNILVGMG